MFIIKINNTIISVILSLLIVIPIGLFYLIDYCINKKIRNKIDHDFIFMVKSFIKLAGILSLILFITTVVISDTNINSYLLLAIYYCSIIAIIISFNYFSIRNTSYRKNIIVFLEVLIDFFKEKFILHLALFIFCWLFKNNNSILLGLIGSYIFFFLEQLNKAYIKNKVAYKMPKLFIPIQFIINFLLLYYLTDIEKFYLLTQKNDIIIPTFYEITIHSLIVMILFIFNYNYDFLIKILDKPQKTFKKIMKTKFIKNVINFFEYK